MLPSSTHLMPVIGLDLHLATSGNPFHPYVGMVIDPFDYITFLGSNVNINGLKRDVSDTSGVLITFQYIPLVGRLHHDAHHRAREHDILPDGLCRGDAFKSQGIYGNDLQRRGHSFFGSIEQGKQEKVQVHSNPLRPDILLHSHSDRCTCHGGRSLCPRLGRYADGAFVKHRLQYAAQFCPCHIEGYEESGEKRRKFI